MSRLDSEGKRTPAGHKMRREQWGDTTVGDMNGTGLRRFDPENFPGKDWRQFAKDQFVDTGAATGPTMKDRARGERAIKAESD